MKQIIALFSLAAAGLVAVFALGCAKAGPSAAANEPEQMPGHENHAPETAGATAPKDKFKAALTTTPAQVIAGAETTLSFTVKDEKGATVKNLQIVHEKPLHLLVVSADLAQFDHIHPEPQTDGAYLVKHKFSNGGAYRLYADYTPPGAHQVVDQFDLQVSGAPRATTPLTEDKTFTKTESGLNVTMKPDKPLRAGDELMLNFTVSDAATGKPANDLQKYLGELAHFVIISQDLKQFLHVHPMAAGAKGATVSAHTTFPQAGMFKLWAQFQRNGQVITVPFTVNVAEGAKAKAGISDGKAQMPEAIKITVSKDGYTPERVTVKAGQPVKLAFYRADAQNCGGEIVFPKLNIRKKLPVGQTVVVELAPQESGELTFACGMNMMKGAVIVN